VAAPTACCNILHGKICSKDRDTRIKTFWGVQACSQAILTSPLKKKVKAIPVTGSGGLWGYEMLRIPQCLDSQFTDGNKAVSLTHRPRNTPQKHLSYPRNRPWRPIGLWDVRIPHCLDNRLTDGGNVVSPTHPQHFTPQNHYYFYVPGTHFC
jgi:hypothetical protein